MIVILGAGIAGVSAAYQLSVKHGQRVTLIDELEPLTLTSDKGTQGYRNWWPGPDDTMLRFVSRSIDLLEEMATESGNVFRLNRRGYLFATAEEKGARELRATAERVSALGMGDLRVHERSGDYRAAPAEGFRDQPTGADLLIESEALRAFPFLNERTKVALHVRRAGWMNAIALGDWMLRRAIAAGTTVVRGRVESIEQRGGRVTAVRLAGGELIELSRLVIAAGPRLPEVARMLGVELPLILELHAKVTVRDPHRTIPRWAPFVIWNDPVELAWSDDQRAALSGNASTRRLLERFPGGVHARPVDGPHGDELFLIWTFETTPSEFIWPPRFDSQYGEICVRGIPDMAPAMSVYADAGVRTAVDGGYYCKTPENRPLIGALPVEGAYVLGALSGFGIMAAHAGAELLAEQLVGAPERDYAKWFRPSRYDDPAYVSLAKQWGAGTGQL